MRRMAIGAFLISIGLLWAGNTRPVVKLKNIDRSRLKKVSARVPFLTGAEVLPYRPSPITNSLATESPGDIVGYTAYEYQQNGTEGNRCIVDPNNGYVHHDWMAFPIGGGFFDRQCKYNVWYDGAFQLGEGQNATGTARGGYVTLGVLPDGRAVCAFHEGFDQTNVGIDYHSAISIDDAPGAGTFSTIVPIDTLTIPAALDSNPIWPRIAIDGKGIIHIFAHPTTADSAHKPGYHPGWSNCLFYSRSTDGGLTFSPWTVLVDSSSGYEGWDPAVATYGDKIGVLYEVPLDTAFPFWFFVNLYLIESTDNGETWGSPQKITEYEKPPIDSQGYLLGFFRNNDLIYDKKGDPHIVFLEHLMIPVYDEEGEPGFLYMWDSRTRVIHWSSKTGFSVVSGQGALLTPDPDRPGLDTLGLWGMSREAFSEWIMPIGVARPQLIVGDGDTLYCVFVGSRDTSDYSLAGFMNGDIYMTVSTDGGKTWGAYDSSLTFRPDRAANLTKSHSPFADAGDCFDDRYVTACPWVYNDTIHLQYICDRDAAPYVIYYDYTTQTNNPVLYLRVPTKPDPQNPSLVYDSTDYIPPTLGIAELPTSPPLAFHKAKPSIFHNSTLLSYTLPSQTQVDLRVYDATGKLVKTLVDAEEGPGVKEIVWNGRDDKGRLLPNGVYFCRLKASGRSLVRKLVLLR